MATKKYIFFIHAPKKDVVLSSSLYTKPTDENTPLHAQSFHPSQLTGLKKTREHQEEYEKGMLSKFRERNYKEDWLVCGENKVDSKSREAYLEVQTL